MTRPHPLPQPPPLTAEHRVRNSALEPEKTWCVSGDTLSLGIQGQGEIKVPLASIHRVRLAYEPTRVQLDRFRCHLYNQGGKIAVLQNSHYKGIGSFEDRSASYRAFVRTLIPRIASVNPRCLFTSGTSYLSWWAHALFLAFAFLFLGLVLVYLYSAFGPMALLKLIIISFFIPATMRWFKRNWPRNFLPHAIPDYLLPKTPAVENSSPP